jgi:hypothetical protein
LFTHPAAALAFKVGDAKAVVRVVAGAAAVAVPPMLIAVGSTDIAGTVGDVYVPPVDESPDPPATFCWLGALGCMRTSATAVTIALTPTPAENHVSGCARIDYLRQRANSLTSVWLLATRRISESDRSASSDSYFVSTSRTVHIQLVIVDLKSIASSSTALMHKVRGNGAQLSTVEQPTP